MRLAPLLACLALAVTSPAAQADRSDWTWKATGQADVIDGEEKATGGVRLDDDKIGRMGFWTPPTDENRAIRKVEAENLSNDGAIWVTSAMETELLGIYQFRRQGLY